MIKINFDKIKNETWISLDTAEQLLLFVKNEIDYLSLHNKNYTKRQYSGIIDLQSIINAIEEV